MASVLGGKCRPLCRKGSRGSRSHLPDGTWQAGEGRTPAVFVGLCTRRRSRSVSRTYPKRPFLQSSSDPFFSSLLGQQARMDQASRLKEACGTVTPSFPANSPTFRTNE